MRLSDFKEEEALDVLADIIEPLAMILSDEEIQKLSKQKNVPTIKYIKPAIKNHKTELLTVLARLENMPVEEYKETVNLITLPKQLMDLVNDPEVQSLFRSQEQSLLKSSASSVPVTEITEAKES